MSMFVVQIVRLLKNYIFQRLTVWLVWLEPTAENTILINLERFFFVFDGYELNIGWFSYQKL